MKETILTEKYRPKKISEVILPKRIKDQFLDYAKKGEFPHLFLVGGPGCGKTTIAKALLNELDSDYIVINGSLNGNIDTLRNDIKNFATSVSLFKKGKKYVILDEADGLNPLSVQPALRNFMEEYSANCGFILTANYKNKIIEPLQSRLFTIEFSFTKEETTHMMADFFKRIKQILEQESIEYDQKTIVNFIKNRFPDMRKILNDLQGYSVNGKIDAGILISDSQENIAKLVSALKDRNFTNMRKWVAENNHMDTYTIARSLYDQLDGLMTPPSIAQTILTISKYVDMSTRVADQEIVNAAFLTELLADGEWL